MLWTKKAGALAILITGICVLLAGCGGSSSSGAMSAQEFQSKGNSICEKSLQQVKVLGVPASASQLPAYLTKALKLTNSLLSQLKSLRPPSTYKQPFQAALSGASRSSATLNEFSKKLNAKQVSASAFGEITKQTAAENERINANFTQAGLSDCAKEG